MDWRGGFAITLTVLQSRGMERKSSISSSKSWKCTTASTGHVLGCWWDTLLRLTYVLLQIMSLSATEVDAVAVTPVHSHPDWLMCLFAAWIFLSFWGRCLAARYYITYQQSRVQIFFLMRTICTRFAHF